MRMIDADYVLEVIKEVKDPTVAKDVLEHKRVYMPKCRFDSCSLVEAW